MDIKTGQIGQKAKLYVADAWFYTWTLTKVDTQLELIARFRSWSWYKINWSKSKH